MENNVAVYTLIFLFFGIPILFRFLPFPSRELRRKAPVFFWLIIVVGTLSIIIVTLSVTSGLGDFFKMVTIFIKDGCFVCN